MFILLQNKKIPNLGFTSSIANFICCCISCENVFPSSDTKLLYYEAAGCNWKAWYLIIFGSDRRGGHEHLSLPPLLFLALHVPCEAIVGPPTWM